MSEDGTKELQSAAKVAGAVGGLGTGIVTAAGTSASAVAGAMAEVGVATSLGAAAQGAGIATVAAGEVTAVYSSAAVIGTTVAAVGAAFAGGLLIGNEITEHTQVDETLCDGMYDLVGEERAYEAVQAFDRGDYLEGTGHMIAGAGETVADAAGDAYDAVAGAAGDAYDSVSGAASDAADWVGDLFE